MAATKASRTAGTRPTRRQAEFLTFIRVFTDRWGVPPSFEEIGRHFRVTAPSVNSMVKTLAARGFITRIPGAARTLRVVVPEAALGERRDGLGWRTEDSTAEGVRAAVELASAVVERIVPALNGTAQETLFAALNAVGAALDIACATAGALPSQRRDAAETLHRVAQLALGASPETRPGRKRRWWRRT